MKSMTGSGHSVRETPDVTMTVDIRSVNARSLDVRVSGPHTIVADDREIAALVAAIALRGTVEITVHLERRGGTDLGRVNAGAARAARELLDDLARSAGIDARPTIADIMRFDGVIDHSVPDSDGAREQLLACVEDALREWDRSRSAEGSATRDAIARHLERIEAMLLVARDHEERAERRLIAVARERFAQLPTDQTDEGRLYAEVASMLIRSSTREECDRLASHLTVARELLDRDGAVGKRFDFLCQEMHREINTTGSKTPFAVVQQSVVDAKDALEAIREQLRNVE